jgi:DNA-binding NtrC family response regulator
MNPATQLESFRAEPAPVMPLSSMVERSVEPVVAEGVSSLVIRSGTTVQEMEKALILETLRATQNNRTEAAKLLGISIRTLRNKLHEYRGEGIPIEE